MVAPKPSKANAIEKTISSIFEFLPAAQTDVGAEHVWREGSGGMEGI
jgi:hypothetical protein